MQYLASPGQVRAEVIRWSLVTVPALLALGFLAGGLANSGPGNHWFDLLQKPGIYPPPQVFGIVWSILYAMMGVALALVLAAHGAEWRGAAIAVFVVQLVINLAWSPVFFGMHMITAALAIIAVLALAVGLTIALFVKVRRAAGLLLVPYLAWVLFAAVLNWQFLAMNPDADGQEDSGAAVRVEL